MGFKPWQPVIADTFIIFAGIYLEIQAMQEAFKALYKKALYRNLCNFMEIFAGLSMQIEVL